MSRILNVASALLFISAIFGVFFGLQHLFLPSNYINDGLHLFGMTVSEIRDFSPKLMDFIEVSVRLIGLYLLSAALSFCVVTLIPYRKGEKWAWYAGLVIGGILQFGVLILVYIGVTLGITPSWAIPFFIILIIVWIVGLALPAKEILGKPSS